LRTYFTEEWWQARRSVVISGIERCKLTGFFSGTKLAWSDERRSDSAKGTALCYERQSDKLNDRVAVRAFSACSSSGNDSAHPEGSHDGRSCTSMLYGSGIRP
jgi:hypothetical protein